MFAPVKARLRIAGGRFAVLGVDHSKLSGMMLSAYAQIESGRGEQALPFLKRVQTDPRATPADAAAAGRLSTFVTNSLEVTGASDILRARPAAVE